MNLNNLYYFKVMAQYQHYTRAAEFLCITQPSLSHAMAALEKEFGVPLFEKDGRNVRLSKYGRLLDSYVSRGFHEIESGNHLLMQFSKKDSGIIDFSFLFVLGYQFVPMLIKKFYENEVHKNITIQFNQCNTRTSLEKIKDGSIDVSLCTYMANEPEIDFRPVLKQELICITSADHPLAERTGVSMEELLPYPIIRYIDATGEIQDLIERLFYPCHASPQTLCCMEEEITMAGLVSTGHSSCIAIVPDLEILQNYNIKKIRLNHPDAYRKIYLAVSKNRPIPPLCKNLL
ncbi:LysR family transcriptional regulator [Clostridium sp. AM58-1XD]|uniref:LysR family transcriptional regulator n=1 Tax=Clostridium sp. AM58-1XD TaxID=2292307 RepID=UPI000E52AF89|nr:LysR family transcriptional regulator [Clostridium sp. AM58-1XD]RGY97719.1 LysR family transcriptional regulator [Clostridium sp. AM58-1XD]